MIVKFSDYVLYKEFAGGNNPVGNNQGNANQNAQGQGGQGQLNHPLGSHPVPSPVTAPGSTPDENEEINKLDPNTKEAVIKKFSELKIPSRLKNSFLKAANIIKNQDLAKDRAKQLITALIDLVAMSSNISKGNVAYAAKQTTPYQK